MKYTEYIKKENCNLFIITDENKRPMTWSKGNKQLCYSDSLNEYDAHWEFEPLFVLQVYTYKLAMLYIKKSKAKNINRKNIYQLMPILPISNTKFSVNFKPKQP